MLKSLKINTFIHILQMVKKKFLLNTKTEIKSFKGRELIKLTNTDNENLLTLDKLNQINKQFK